MQPDVPSFLIIGAMKAGSTSLYTWLGQQPNVFVPRVKEPNFFVDENQWSKGLDWYRRLFAGASIEHCAGEASVKYTDPSCSLVAAARISSVLPDVKLIFLVRDPIERMRSHYRHEVLRGREHRTFLAAVADPGSKYAVRSHYFTCLHPYLVRFRRTQIQIVRTEELFGPSDEPWKGILSFLGIPERPRPRVHLNSSVERAQYNPAMRIAWDAGLRHRPRFLPAPVRRALRPLFLRRHQSPLLSTAGDPVRNEMVHAIREDVRRLEEWMEGRMALIQTSS